MTTAARTAITRAAPDGAAALARTLARELADDPVSAWLFPRDGSREERLARASALLVEVSTAATAIVSPPISRRPSRATARSTSATA